MNKWVLTILPTKYMFYFTKYFKNDRKFVGKIAINTVTKWLPIRG